MQDRLRQLHNNYVDADSPYFIARCLGVTDESHDVKTFKFEGAESGVPPKSGNILCDPGQFASFDFPDIKDGETLNRTWTISSPQDEMKTSATSSGCAFSVTIKKVGPRKPQLHHVSISALYMSSMTCSTFQHVSIRTVHFSTILALSKYCLRPVKCAKYLYST